MLAFTTLMAFAAWSALFALFATVLVLVLLALRRMLRALARLIVRLALREVTPVRRPPRQAEAGRPLSWRASARG